MVLHSLSCHPSSWQGWQRDGKTGASLGWLPAHKDGSVGAGARAELPDVNQRIGFGTCPADGRLCSRLPVQPALLGLLGRCPILSKNLAQSVGLLKQEGLSCK